MKLDLSPMFHCSKYKVARYNCCCCHVVAELPKAAVHTLHAHMSHVISSYPSKLQIFQTRSQSCVLQHAVVLLLCALRIDSVVPMADIADRIQKWRDNTVGKATKAAEQTLLKAFKKSGASINSPEAMQQLKDVVEEAGQKAEEFFASLSVPLCRLGSTSETSTARGKAMLEALQKAQNTATPVENSHKVGLAAALAEKEREGAVKSKKKNSKAKGTSDKNSSKNCLLTLGKHMLK